MAIGAGPRGDDTTGTGLAETGVMVAIECIVGPVYRVRTEVKLGVPNRRGVELVLQDL